MKLAQFHDLKCWHERHWREQPLEKNVWEGILTLWVVGWVGAPTALVTHAGWALALCAGCLILPGSYVALRRVLHGAGVLRCDWIAALH